MGTRRRGIRKNMKGGVKYISKSTNVPHDQYPKPNDVIHPSDKHPIFSDYNASFVDEHGNQTTHYTEKRDINLEKMGITRGGRSRSRSRSRSRGRSRSRSRGRSSSK